MKIITWFRDKSRDKSVKPKIKIKTVKPKNSAAPKKSVKSKIEIETVKWSWAKPVKSKNIYRDDEFIRTKTKEEALKAIDSIMTNRKGSTYTITVHRDDEFFTYSRHGMPCLGGLVKYRDSHGEKHFMNPYFPRDIRVAFPEGDIVFIAQHRLKAKDIFDSPYFEFAFSEESPWISAFGTKDTVLFKDNHFVLTNMDTDPTVFYSLMRLGGLAGSIAYAGGGNKCHPKATILACKTAYADPRRLAGQKPMRISGGTWAEGFGYTRPYNESIYKTSLPTKLKDFGKLAGYPQAPHTNEYFISTMKKVFGIEIAKEVKGREITPKAEQTLVEAWDYFKEEAKKLEE